jgi:hypothetical protein
MRRERIEGLLAGRGEAGSAGALVLMLVLLVVTLGLVLMRQVASPPVPASAPAGEFSGARAHEVLARLVGDGQPHPVGSAADDRVRAEIVTTLERLGYQPRVEEGFACQAGGACARVHNVVATLAGREPGKAVAVAAHYDSVGAGPGASDDLSGIAAILEMARALKSGPVPRHSVLLLLDEGEETGLLGASTFEDGSPERDDVAAVVNLDARGTRGPSFMFETTGDNAWMVDSWAARAPRPVTTSLAAFLYSLLPNDTDLTVFRHHRVPGLNFAFIGGVANYHTPYDNLANASPASLQHQGENGFAALTGLANADLDHRRGGNLVYFDVLSMGVVRWPAGWSLGLAGVALLGLIVLIVLAMRSGALPGSDFGLGLLVVPVTLVVTALAAAGLQFALITAGPLMAQWLAHPGPVTAAFWLLGLTVAAAVAPMLGRRGDALALWAGVWIIWAVVAAALAVVAPATSYLFVAPALVAAICGLLAGVWRGRPEEGVSVGLAFAAIVPGLVAALAWFGVVPAIQEGLGAVALGVVAVLVAILLTTVAPLFAGGGGLGRRLWPVALVLMVVAVVAALPQARFEPWSPQRTNFTFYQDADSGAARWVLSAQVPLPAILHAASFGPAGPAYPWSPPGATARSAPAPALAGAAAAPPEVQVRASTVEGGKRHVKLHLVSHRGAPIGILWAPGEAQVESVAIEGHAVPASSAKNAPQRSASGWQSYSDVTLPISGCDVELVLGDGAPHDWYVADMASGLPATAAALVLARPATAVPIQNGDVTVISHKVRI